MKKIKIKENRLLIYEGDKPLHDLALENTDIHLHPSENGILLSNTTDMYSERKGITLLFSEIEPNTVEEFLALLEELKKQDVTPIEKVVEKLEANCDENPLNVNVCNQIDLTPILLRMQVINNSLQNIKTGISELKGVNEAILGQLKNDCKAIIKELKSTEKLITNGNVHLGTISNKISTVQTKLDTLKQKLESLDTNTDELEGKIQEVSNKITRLQTALIAKFDESKVLLNEIKNKLNAECESAIKVKFCGSEELNQKLDKIVSLLEKIVVPLTQEDEFVDDDCGDNDTTAPVVTGFDNSAITKNHKDTITPTLQVSDDDTNLTYEWSSNCDKNIAFSDATVKEPTITFTNTTADDIVCVISVKVCDSSNNCTTIKKEVTIKGSLDVTAPVVTGFDNSPITKNHEDTITPTLQVSDDDTNLIYEWSSLCGEENVVFSDVTAKEPIILFKNKTQKDVICVISVKICDSSNNCTIIDKEVTIRNIDNVAPVITGFDNSPITKNDEDTITPKIQVSDDDPNLTYEWSSTCGEDSIVFSDKTVKEPIILFKNKTGKDKQCYITLKVCDSAGNCTSIKKQIIINRDKFGKSIEVVTPLYGDYNDYFQSCDPSNKGKNKYLYDYYLAHNVENVSKVEIKALQDNVFIKIGNNDECISLSKNNWFTVPNKEVLDFTFNDYAFVIKFTFTNGTSETYYAPFSLGN